MPAVGDLVRCADGSWMVRPPERCPRRHRLPPGRTLVGHQPSNCAPAGGGQGDVTGPNGLVISGAQRWWTRSPTPPPPTISVSVSVALLPRRRRYVVGRRWIGVRHTRAQSESGEAQRAGDRGFAGYSSSRWSATPSPDPPGRPGEGENMSVYRVTEVIGTSTESWEHAARSGSRPPL